MALSNKTCVGDGSAIEEQSELLRPGCTQGVILAELSFIEGFEGRVGLG
jgi:hypothetical protein